MGSYDLIKCYIKGVEKVNIRHLVNWAKMYGVSYGPMAEYCSNLSAADKLPRGVKKHETVLRNKILKGIKGVYNE